jgi:hypothetical protein
MRDGECWEQRTLEQSIRGTEYGLSEKWATPTTMDKLPPKSEQSLLREATVTRLGRSKPANLRDQVSNMQNWPTPNSRDWKDGQTSGNRKSPGLGVMAHLGTNNGGQLNPEWVEKLMGWPNNWSCINNISHTKMMFWVMGFYDDEENCTNKILQMLRQGNVSKEVQQQIGRPVDILEAAVLLSELCKYSDRPYEARIFISCKKVFEEEVRGLRSQQITASPSYGSGHQEQSFKQHTDTLQTLSRFLAYHGKEAWKTNSWEDAIPRVERDIPSRVDRLKAIGNGQVPLCAATAWRVLNAGWN